MRKVYLLTLVVLTVFTSNIQAQSSKCGTAVPNITFQQLLRNVQAQSQQMARLAEAKRVVQNNCVSATQLKEMAALLENDYDRLDLCKTAYINTADKENFVEVYDAFAYFSTVFRLHDFVKEQKPVPAQQRPRPVPTPAPSNPWSNITYPDWRAYKGNTGCETPLADNDFDYYFKNIQAMSNDADKMGAAGTMSNTGCLTVAQLMRIGISLELESNRLALFKQTYARAYDQGNYLKMIQVFKHQPNQDNLIAFYNEQNKPNPSDNTPPTCTVSDADFNSIKTTLNKQTVESNRLNTAKQIMRSKKCFTVNQVKALVNTLRVESYKLELAKFAYDFTTNTGDYYQVSDVLGVESYKRELMDFLEKK